MGLLWLFLKYEASIILKGIVPSSSREMEIIKKENTTVICFIKMRYSSNFVVVCFYQNYFHRGLHSNYGRKLSSINGGLLLLNAFFFVDTNIKSLDSEWFRKFNSVFQKLMYFKSAFLL